MRVRSEEHRALRDLLPEDVRSGAVQLNVASREAGGESLITPACVRDLGEAGVRRVVEEATGDPSRAARLLARLGGERGMSTVRNAEREEDRGR